MTIDLRLALEKKLAEYDSKPAMKHTNTAICLRAALRIEGDRVHIAEKFHRIVESYSHGNLHTKTILELENLEFLFKKHNNKLSSNDNEVDSDNDLEPKLRLRAKNAAKKNIDLSQPKPAQLAYPDSLASSLREETQQLLLKG